ncbi:hypothetical protein C1H76_7536 [Elsinoe australis]|uniref:Uncharacterized protein n=1 Tax=Elsinoe australis TaxID=40998 RepID=A0A4U7AQ44_9PEZI|nr:hypothetical protein C1H76_7536 [Elsinoe australis]
MSMDNNMEVTGATLYFPDAFDRRPYPPILERAASFIRTCGQELRAPSTTNEAIKGAESWVWRACVTLALDEERGDSRLWGEAAHVEQIWAEAPMIDPDISPETAAKYGNQSWENFKKIMQRTRRTTNSAEARPAAAKRSTSKRVLAIEEDSQPKRTEAGRNERALKAEA